MVGMVSRMRVSSVITPSLRGTLKSTRMKRRLSVRSRSRIESLDMATILRPEGLVGNESVGFDFDSPGRIEQSGDHDHRGGGADGAEELTVDAAGLLPVLRMGEVDAGAVDVVEGAAALLQGSGDEIEALGGWGRQLGSLRGARAGSGDVDLVADADGAGEADDGLIGGGAGDVGAEGHGRFCYFGFLFAASDSRSASTSARSRCRPIANLFLMRNGT